MRLLRSLLLLSLLAAARPAPVQAQTTPTETQVVNALEKVKQDPNLATQTTIKTLKWRERPSAFEWPAWIKWLGHLVAWFDQSVRGLLWVTIMILAGLLGLFLRRIFSGREPLATGDRLVAPTHVQDLDIRPESLPADIGHAARALWDRGDHRAALALLYRGLLSRLAHVHRVPIRDSTTEGDCVALAAAQLPGDRREYVRALVGVWQRAVYGHEPPETTTVYGLCDGFASSLDGPVLESPSGAAS